MEQSGLRDISTVWEGEWLRAVAKDYELPNGSHHIWEAIEKPKAQKDVESVSIIPTCVQEGLQKMILIANFRAPVAKYIIEWPSGMVDPGEHTWDAALRELKEETGYTASKADITNISPIYHNDPWKSNENEVLISISVDLEDPENIEPHQELDSAENIKVLFIDASNLMQELLNLEQQGYGIDYKVYTHAMGLKAAQNS